MACTAEDWTAPGAHLVAPGVHRVPLPLPMDALRAVNVYVLEAADGLTLVDAGWDILEARSLLATALGAIGAGVEDVRTVLVTHAHRDHYTHAVAVRRAVGCSIGLGAGERPTIELVQAGGSGAFDAQVERLRRAGAGALAAAVAELSATAGPLEPAQWAPPDQWLRAGPVALPGGRTLDAVETPGHTAGHLVFHDLDAQLLFAGDHVLPAITPSIGFEPRVDGDPLGDFLTSLRIVRERPDAVLLPAHGPVTSSAHARIDELLDHHGRRLDAAAAATADGASTAYEVAQRLTWTRRERSLDELDVFNSMLAVLETESHLALLAAQGRLRLVIEDGVVHFS